MATTKLFIHILSFQWEIYLNKQHYHKLNFGMTSLQDNNPRFMTDNKDLGGNCFKLTKDPQKQPNIYAQFIPRAQHTRI